MNPLIFLPFLAMAAHGAVTVNQLEPFNSLGGWTSGNPNPNPPSILADSGPLGPGDSALMVTSNGGSGAGGKLLSFNKTDWAGDFTGNGIISVSADLRNQGSTALSIRLAFNGPGGWFVTQAAAAPAFVGWVPRSFDIRTASLLPTDAGSTDAAATMASVSEMRILHSSTPDHKGAQTSGSFLVDNIRAVPEPGLFAISLLSGVILVARRHRSGIVNVS